MKEKEKLLSDYFQLARKLNKLPTSRETNRFGHSERQVAKLFGSFTKMKAEALKQFPELELYMPTELKVEDLEQYRLGLEASARTKKNKKLVGDVHTLDYIEKFAEQVFAGKIQGGKPPAKAKKIDRVHTLMLSDLHFGADLAGDETGTSDFKVQEESRRFAMVIQEAATYKEQYRKETRLVVALLGDVIENAMHDPRTGATIAEQVCRAIHYLSQGIAYLATHYPEVEVHCSSGNHDRNTARHKTRAIHQKFDSLGTVIYYALKTALKDVKNVKFVIPKTPLASYEVFGRKIAYTHGDTVIKPGNPYKSVNVGSLENQINKINAALPDNQEYAAFLYGHTHIAHIVHLMNGTVLIGNGGLPPSDHFGVSLGSYETNNGQWIFESVPGYPVGDMRLIKVDRTTDKDESLDKIIKPWTDF